MLKNIPSDFISSFKEDFTSFKEDFTNSFKKWRERQHWRVTFFGIFIAFEQLLFLSLFSMIYTKIPIIIQRFILFFLLILILAFSFFSIRKILLDHNQTTIGMWGSMIITIMNFIMIVALLSNKPINNVFFMNIEGLLFNSSTCMAVLLIIQPRKLTFLEIIYISILGIIITFISINWDRLAFTCLLALISLSNFILSDGFLKEKNQSAKYKIDLTLLYKKRKELSNANISFTITSAIISQIDLKHIFAKIYNMPLKGINIWVSFSIIIIIAILYLLILIALNVLEQKISVQKIINFINSTPFIDTPKNNIIVKKNPHKQKNNLRLQRKLLTRYKR